MAHTDTEDETAAADAVEGAVALGDLERVVVRERQDAGQEADASGARGEIAECGQRIPVARSRRQVPRGHLGGNGNVLATGEALVAEAFGGLGDPRHVVDRRLELPCTVRPRKL